TKLNPSSMRGSEPALEMPGSNLRPLDELANVSRKAWARVKASRQEWIAGTLELALAIFEARSKFTSNQDFGKWLDDVGLTEISKDDRGALVHLGEYIDITRRALETTESASWRLIWQNEVEPQTPEFPASQSANTTGEAGDRTEADRKRRTWTPQQQAAHQKRLAGAAQRRAEKRAKLDAEQRAHDAQVLAQHEKTRADAWARFRLPFTEWPE